MRWEFGDTEPCGTGSGQRGSRTATCLRIAAASIQVCPVCLRHGEPAVDDKGGTRRVACVRRC